MNKEMHSLVRLSRTLRVGAGSISFIIFLIGFATYAFQSHATRLQLLWVITSLLWFPIFLLSIFSVRWAAQVSWLLLAVQFLAGGLVGHEKHIGFLMGAIGNMSAILALGVALLMLGAQITRRRIKALSAASGQPPESIQFDW